MESGHDVAADNTVADDVDEQGGYTGVGGSVIHQTIKGWIRKCDVCILKANG